MKYKLISKIAMDDLFVAIHNEDSTKIIPLDHMNMDFREIAKIYKYDSSIIDMSEALSEAVELLNEMISKVED
jgi:hypothetical protein